MKNPLPVKFNYTTSVPHKDPPGPFCMLSSIIEFSLDSSFPAEIIIEITNLDKLSRNDNRILYPIFGELPPGASENNRVLPPPNSWIVFHSNGQKIVEPINSRSLKKLFRGYISTNVKLVNSIGIFDTIWFDSGFDVMRLRNYFYTYVGPMFDGDSTGHILQMSPVIITNAEFLYISADISIFIDSVTNFDTPIYIHICFEKFAS